ncbi:hypothetical protein HDU67_009757 [Dinochytrium kinnereticum]|nr:hypothetical protein HDU67_009757 [Dinochytrium kinnereticum]
MADLHHPTEFDSFVANHVRKVLRKNETRQKMLETLESGQPFVEKVNFAVVVMLDISGYTALTSKLAKKGKVSSELVTKSVGEYLIKLIDIISYFQGDIVRFLGDALLVTFTPISDYEEDTLTILRSIQCCSQILRYYSKMEINLDIDRLPQQPDNNDFITQREDTVGSAVSSRPLWNARSTIKVRSGTSRSMRRSGDLRLHVGITAGPIARLFIGSPKDRMDYCVTGDCLEMLGSALDKAHAETLGIPLAFWETELWPRFRAGAGGSRESEWSLPFGFKVQDDVVVCENLGIEFLHTMSSFLILQEIGRLSNTTAPVRDSGFYEVEGCDFESCDKRVREFIEGQLFGSEINTSTFSTQKGKEGSIKSVYTLTRFINKAIVYKLSPGSESDKRRLTRRSTVNSTGSKLPTFQSEFRTITVLFVKFHQKLTAHMTNRVMVSLISILNQLGGVYQQCSVDDKGLSMLACFGLPPLASENVSACAVLAALRLSKSLELLDIQSSSISLATGEILFSVIGNNMRAEAGLLGDVVNVAARLLSVKAKQSKNYVVCDEATHSIAGGHFEYDDLGQYTFKGKEELVQVYAVKESNKMPENLAKDPSAKQHFGYNDERKILSDGLSEWLEGTKENFFCRAKKEDVLARHGSEKRIGSRRNTVSSFRMANASQDINSSWTITGNSTWNTAEISTFLKSIGESDDKLEALFHILKIDHGRKKKGQKENNLDLGELSSQLESIASKTLTFFQNFPSSRPILMIDDCQYIDSSSAQVLQFLISQACVKMCIFMFSRPLDNYPFAEAIGKIRSLPFVKRLSLRGLSENDIEKYIVWKLDVEDVVISPNLVSAIKERSKGNPIFVEFLVNIVAWRRERLQPIGNTSVMSFTFTTAELESLLSYDVAEAINVNFDKVHPDLQELLKVVSIFGMQFNLDDVSAVWTSNQTEKTLVQLMATYDKYSFLIPLNLNESEVQINVYAGVHYGFRHQTIMEAIYERIPYRFRSEMHCRIAAHFESSGSDHNNLPLLSYHYSRSSNIPKKIHYLEKLSFFYSESFSISECISTITQLTKFIDDNHDLIAANNEVAPILDGLRQADLYATMAWCYALQMSPLSLDCAQKSLAYLSEEWPRNDKMLKKATARAAIRLVKIWMRTRGGRKPDQRINLETSRILSLAYNAIREYSFWNASTSKFEYLVSIIRQTQIHLEKGEDYFLAGTLLRFAFALSWVAPSLSNIFTRRGKEISYKLPPLQLEKLKMLNHLFWIDSFRKGDYNAAHKFASDYVENRLKHRDSFSAYAGYYLVVLCEFHRGIMHSKMIFFQEMNDDLAALGMHEYIIWGSFALAIHGVHTGNLELASYWLERCKNGCSKIKAEQLHAGYLTAAAFFALATGNMQETLRLFREASHAYSTADRVTVGYFQTGTMLVFIVWVIIMPSTSGVLGVGSGYLSLHPESKELLLASLRDIRKTNKHLGKTLDIWPSYWSFQLGEAATRYISKNSGHAASVIKLALKDSRKTAPLADFLFVRTLVYGVYGRTAVDATDRAAAMADAQQSVADIDSGLLKAWLQ